MEELQTFSVLGFIIKAVNCKLVIFFLKNQNFYVYKTDKITIFIIW